MQRNNHREYITAEKGDVENQSNELIFQVGIFRFLGQELWKIKTDWTSNRFFESKKNSTVKMFATLP